MQANDQYDAILDIKRKKDISTQFMTEDIIGHLSVADEQERLGIARTEPVMEVRAPAMAKKADKVDPCVKTGGRAVVRATLLLCFPSYFLF